jgi:hypothetical protein
MAVVTITLTDNGDAVDIVLESDPPIPGRASERERTLAQDMSIRMLDAVATPDDITHVEGS